jgi:hypothetical protein
MRQILLTDYFCKGLIVYINGIPRFQLDMAARADFQAAVVQPNIPAHHVFK